MKTRMRYPLTTALAAVAAAAAFVAEQMLPGSSTLLAGAAVLDPEKVEAELKRISDQVKDFGEKALKQIQEKGSMDAETKKRVDEALIKQGELMELATGLKARMLELEQKALGGGRANGLERQKSIGELVVDDEEFKAFAKMGTRARGTIAVLVKAITSAGNSAGSTVETQRNPGVRAAPEETLRVRSLLMPGRTTSNSIEDVQETGFTNAAAVVAEGAQKPESNIVYGPKTVPVVTIAHWIHASKQIMDDSVGLQSRIDGRLRYGLKLVEDRQLLKGSGVGGNIEGLVTAATAYAAPAGLAAADDNAIDRLRIALVQSELAEYPSTGIVINPVDWALIELSKTNDGAYLFANPQSLATARLWNRDVVTTVAMDQNEFLVGAFMQGAQIFDREDANVVISTEDRDNFIKNMLTIRAEERLALFIYRPEAFITGELVDTP